jgi:hypothetical protein
MSGNIRKAGLTKGTLKYTKEATDDLLSLIKEGLKALNVSYRDECCPSDANLGYGGCPQCTGNYAQFYSLLDQRADVPNVTQAIVIEETAFASNISMQSDGTNLTRITFDTPGIYDIQFSVQLHHTQGGGSGDNIHIWFRQNNVDIPASNSIVHVRNNTFSIAGWNIFVDIQNSGDFVQIVGYPTNVKIILEHVDATLTEPAVPSVIVTVNQVG